MLPMQSTMSDFQLTIGSIFEHGVRVHSESEVITCMGDRARRSTFREVGDRVRRLACALQRLGIRPGDRVVARRAGRTAAPAVAASAPSHPGVPLTGAQVQSELRSRECSRPDSGGDPVAEDLR